MAQLRYSKAIACGTAVTVGLVGAYLYKNITSRNALNKKLDLTEGEGEEGRVHRHHCRETCTARCECEKGENAEDIVATAKVSPLGGGDTDVDNLGPCENGREKNGVESNRKRKDKGGGDPGKKGGKESKAETSRRAETNKKSDKKEAETVDPDRKGVQESKKANKKSPKKVKELDRKEGETENKKTVRKDRNTASVTSDKQGKNTDAVKMDKKGRVTDKENPERRGDAENKVLAEDVDRSEMLQQTMEGFEELMFASEETSGGRMPVEESVVLQSLNEAATESSAPWFESVSEVVSQEGRDNDFVGDAPSAVQVKAGSAVDPEVPAATPSREGLKKAGIVFVEGDPGKGVISGTGNHHDSSMVSFDGGSEANSEGSDSGHGSSDTSSVGKDQSSSPELPPMPVLYQFEFPSDLCGRFIGKQGRNVKELRDQTGVKIFLKPLAVSTKYQLCILDGLPKNIEKALEVIKRRFPEVDTSRQSLTADDQGMNVKMPGMSQLQLPDEGVSNIILTSVVSAGHVFLQQPGQSSFNALNRLNNCMNGCYCQKDRVPPLPQPIEVGIVCAAPVMDSWYRAQLINYYPEENEADLRFLDYGGYARINAGCLRQIRSDFLSLPFQAVECYLANIVPLQGESDFSEDARLFIEQVAQNFTLLQSKTVAYSMDGVPLIEIFYEEAENGNVHSVNRELVERGLAAWYEGVEEVAIEYPEESYLVPVS